MPIAKNEIHTVTICGYTSDGEGVARVDGQVVLVKHAIDGEVCNIRILRVAKNVAWAKIETVLNPSKLRITPACFAFGPCGGCDFLHMSYEEELRLKHQRVSDAITRIGGLAVTVAPLCAAEKTEGYRNKVIFAVGSGPTTGFYRRRSHQIVPITSCLIQSDLANRAAAILRKWMCSYNIWAYDKTTGQGMIRHLFVRMAMSSGEIAICLVAAVEKLPHIDALIESINRHCPEAVSIMLCANKSESNVVLRGELYTLWGEDFLTDTLLGLRFRLSPHSFFQVNTSQAEQLYKKALVYANLTGKETVLDLYCGTGTISLILAKDAKHVIGAEIVASAIRDAKQNAKMNGIENVEFILGDVSDVVCDLSARGIRPDVIVVDPPRKGLAPDVIEQIILLAPSRLIYISCDPATLARDLNRLDAADYKVQEITPIDMFPRCAHVETIALLERRVS